MERESLLIPVITDKLHGGKPSLVLKISELSFQKGIGAQAQIANLPSNSIFRPNLWIVNSSIVMLKFKDNC